MKTSKKYIYYFSYMFTDIKAKHLTPKCCKYKKKKIESCAINNTL